MKHLFKTAYCLLLLAAAGCQKYDDHELWDELDRHARRIADIEAWQDRVENNITALQQLVDALQERRYITGVSEFTTPEPGGYDVGFSSGAPIRIWNGAKGADGEDGQPGATPHIGVKKDTDGNYYWTLNSEWLLDDDTHEKIPVVDPAGADGKTPQVAIGSDGNWYICPAGNCPNDDVSVAGGWENTGVQATGDPGTPGAPGENGATPQIAIGSDGYWYICPAGDCPSDDISVAGGWEATGIQATGDPGAQGADGATPQVAIGSDGNWYICPAGNCPNDDVSVAGGWENTGIQATGDPGPQGPQGDPGAPGENGKTPQIAIGSDGNWYICPAGDCPSDDVSVAGGWEATGIQATGDPGAQGPQGNPGAPGTNGVTPKLRINTATNYWQVCTSGACDITADEGWTNVLGSDGNPVTAVGEKGDTGAQGLPGDAIFAANGVDNSHPDYVEFTLADHTTIQVPKYRPLSIAFPQPLVFANGETREITFTVQGNVQRITAVDVPRGWTVTPDLAGRKITVTAPAGNGKRYAAAGAATLLISDGAERTVTGTLALECPPYVAPESLGITFTQPMAFDLTQQIEFTVTGNVATVNVFNVPAGWSVTLSPLTDNKGTFTITATSAYPCPDCEAFIFVADAAGNTVMRTLRLIANFPESRALDSLTLVSIYNDNPLLLIFGGPTNWLTAPLDQWSGVTVTNGRVTGLDMENVYIRTLRPGRLTALEELNCNNTALTALDVRGCTALKTLYCNATQLTALEVSGCAALEVLGCSSTHLTALEVSGCAALTELYCNNNNSLSTLNASGCTALTKLYCEDNALTALDVRGCTALTKLYCEDNALTALDVRGCTALRELWCFYNQLTSLEVSGCAELADLRCNTNQLTALDVRGCTALTHMECIYNQLTALEVSGCAALAELKCYGNALTALDVSGCAALRDLWCYDNQLAAAALDALFTSLPDRTGEAQGTIYISSNPGTDGCTKTIAEGKNWTVDI